MVRRVGPRVSLLALALVDPDFAKEQLELMLREMYLHPNGQIPAYEWNFCDVNPPVHAWATLLSVPHRAGAPRRGRSGFPRSASFHKLLLNFTWWVNRKDRFGNNVFEGGFLGLDNIGVFDRSSAADRRPSRAGGRHRVDGVVLPEHAGDRPRTRAPTIPPIEDMAVKFWSIPVDRLAMR